MTFTVRKLNYRPWPVTVALLECGEDGKVAEVPQTFVGHFRMFTAKEAAAIRKEVFGDEESDEGKACMAAMNLDDRAELEAKFIARLMCGWAGVNGDAGPLPYSEPALLALATGQDGVHVRRGLNMAVNELLWGIAPLKNFKASPEPGPASGEAEKSSPTISPSSE